MIRHIVVFQVAGESDTERAANVERLQSTLRPLATSIPGIRSLRVEADTTGIATHWDAVLVSEHDSWDDLAAYQVHPDHQAALVVVNAVATGKAVADYEL
jgi:hypothetical protein